LVEHGAIGSQGLKIPFHGGFQEFSQHCMQSPDGFTSQLMNGRRRIDPGQEQRFAGVQVAHPGQP
jgi:hypothetical protein